MKRLLACLFLCTFQIFAQQAKPEGTDSISVASDTGKKLDFKYQQLIIPAVFIGYGIFGLESGQIKGFNHQISSEVTEDIDEKTSIDDFSQYAPTAAVYGLSALGVKAKNSYRDRTIIVATSYLLMGLTVNTFKHTASVERPDKSGLNSFPSGHTATAFMGAELMYQEYKDESIWYGVSGFAVAAGTGAFRMYNNKHWLSDVVAGAGIGILSAKAGYWLFPYTSRIVTKKKQTNTKTAMIPFYDGRTAGFGYVKTF